MPSDRSSVGSGELSRLYRAPTSPRAEHQAQLADQLASRLPTPVAPARSRRWWLGGLVFAGALAGACVIPVEYAMPLGQRVDISLDASLHEEVDPQLLSRFVEAQYDAERIEIHVSMSKHGDGDGAPQGQMQITIMAFGADDIPDELAEDLVDAFPALEQAQVDHEAVAGTVQGTLGGKLGHAWLDVVIDAHGVEEARRRLMADLVARGLSGDAQIEIVDEPGRREVKVRVQAHGDGPHTP